MTDDRHDEPTTLPPWEDRSSFSHLQGFFETIQQAMLSPGRLFRRMSVAHGLWGPLSFYVLLYVLMTLVERMWSSALSGFDIALLSWLEELNDESIADASIVQFLETIGIFFSPLMAVISLFFSSAVIHLSAALLISDNRGFEASFRAVAYAGSALILGLIPVCGSVLSVFWMIGILVVAVRELHGTGTGRALVTVGLPMVVLFCGCMTLTILFGGLIAAAGS